MWHRRLAAMPRRRTRTAPGSTPMPTRILAKPSGGSSARPMRLPRRRHPAFDRGCWARSGARRNTNGCSGTAPITGAAGPLSAEKEDDMAAQGKIAVITGAGSGIGRATAHSLLEAGWNVVLAGRRRDMLEETAQLAGMTPPRTLAVPTDIRDPAQIEGLFAAVKNTYGRIDLLFNNAGISTRGIPFEELTYEQWSDVVAVNLTGSFLCAQHAFRMMKAQDPQGGRIINNGSVSAHVPRRNSTPYVATKHALTGLTRSLSLDGRGLDIACGQIDIGNAATERNTDTSVGRLQATGKVEAEARIDVRHVASGVAYMASLPLDANVQFMTVMATKMPYIGRG